MTDSKTIWIEAGYALFALEGPAGLKVETLARKAGISKSSFYHHFADLELFADFLLIHHLHQSQIIAEKERAAAAIDPELIDVILLHRTDILFNRQLRFHRHQKSFADALEHSNRIIGDAFVAVWVKELGLKLSPSQLAGIFELALENFYLQINPANFNREWLAAYFAQLKSIAQKFE
jgi:AcrR family transcriptional regulator